MDCSLPGSSIHGIFWARVLEWLAIAFSELEMLGYKKAANVGNHLTHIGRSLTTGLDKGE